MTRYRTTSGGRLSRRRATDPHLGADEARRRLWSGAPVEPRRWDLAGVSTALLTGGHGPPAVLLHGQGGFAEMWLPVIAGLAPTRQVIAPDLPGLGASTTPHNGPPDAAAVLAWLDALLDRCCAEPPVLVGHSLGGSIAARFAVEHSDRIAGLVLVDAGGLAGRVRPAPGVLLALIRHSVRPSERSALRLFRHLSADLGRLRQRMGEDWDPFLAYQLDRARAESVQRANRRLLRELGMPGIAPDDLARITVPTTLIWGRDDRVMPRAGAERASRRHGWPLHVVEDAGHVPHLEQPEAVLRVLLSAAEAG